MEGVARSPGPRAAKGSSPSFPLLFMKQRFTSFKVLNMKKFRILRPEISIVLSDFGCRKSFKHL